MADLAIGLGVIAGILLLRQFAPKVPAYLAAVVIATALTALLDLAVNQGVAVVGQIPAGLPGIGLPHAGLEHLGSLVSACGRHRIPGLRG